MGDLKDRDIDCLLRILDYCDRIQAMADRFGSDFDHYLEDDVFQDAVKMNLFQIGETVNSLSDECREEMHGIPWHQIYGMRNVIAHGYESLQEERVWATVVDDIPRLAEQISTGLRERGIDPD